MTEMDHSVTEMEDVTPLIERWYRFALQGLVLLLVMLAGLVTLLLGFIFTETVALSIAGAVVTGLCAALFVLFWYSAKHFGIGYRSFHKYCLRLRKQLAVFLKMIASEIVLVALAGGITACVRLARGGGSGLLFAVFGFCLFALIVFLIGNLLNSRK